METIQAETKPLLFRPFDLLPHELLVKILSHSTLSSVVASTQTCRRFRLVGKDHTAFERPLMTTAVSCGVHMLVPPPQDSPIDLASRTLLAGLAGQVAVPTKSYVALLPFLSRSFILYEMELPRLTDEDWREICRIRFIRSIFGAHERSLAGERVKGGWRMFFVKTLQRYEHRHATGCVKEDNMVSDISLAGRLEAIREVDLACWVAEFTSLSLTDSRLS